MIRHGVAAVVVAIGLLSACSSDSKNSSAGTKAPIASDSPAVPSTGGDGVVRGTPDCAAVKDAYAKLIVNTQILVQLPNTADVAAWPTDIGTMSEFGAQLEQLAAAVGSNADAAAAVAFYQGANDIAERGYGGDNTAVADLAAYLGTDLTAVISKQVPIGVALSTLGC